MAFRPNAMHDLAAGFPRLFHEPPMYACHLPAGWLRLAEELCRDIEAELDGEPASVSQIKEKTGSLRVSLVIGVTDTEVFAVSPDGGLKLARIRELIAKASERSTSICAQCGEPGTVANAGAWYAPLCARHQEAR